MPATVRELAAAYTAQAIETLALIMNDSKAAASSRIAAATALLDRAHGRPVQAIDVEDGGPIAILPVRTMEEAVRIATEAARASALVEGCSDAYPTED